MALGAASSVVGCTCGVSLSLSSPSWPEMELPVCMVDTGGAAWPGGGAVCLLPQVDSGLLWKPDVPGCSPNCTSQGACLSLCGTDCSETAPERCSVASDCSLKSGAGYARKEKGIFPALGFCMFFCLLDFPLKRQL